MYLLGGLLAADDAGRAHGAREKALQPFELGLTCGWRGEIAGDRGDAVGDAARFGHWGHVRLPHGEVRADPARSCNARRVEGAIAV